jgi:hypothetical protein
VIAISNIDIMHMIRKGQLQSTGKFRPAREFYSLPALPSSVCRARFSKFKNLRQNLCVLVTIREDSHHLVLGLRHG